jgi:UDP-glucose 4-epimerase
LCSVLRVVSTFSCWDDVVIEHVVITGGAGFIGSNLVDFFNEASPSTHITVVDDLSTGNRENLANAQCDLKELNILDYEPLVNAMGGADAVIHLAAIGSVPRSVAHPRPTHEANTTGTLNVLEAARVLGVAHVTVASSSSVYGSNPKLPKSESDWTRPMSPYAVSKLATEAYAIAYQASYDLATLAFRFFNVYGPRQKADHDYAAVIPRFVDAAMTGKPLILHGDGTQSRDFTYVGSVCQVLFDAATRRVIDQSPINLAFGTRTTLLDLAAELESILGKEIQREFVERRRGDVFASQADSAMLRELFPDVLPTSLQEGLATTVRWFKKELTDSD